MSCIVCKSDSAFLEYSINHRTLTDDLANVVGETLLICDTCYDHGFIYWCPRCTEAYSVPRDSKDFRISTYDTCTVVVCNDCSLSKKSAIVECDVDKCTSRVRPSHRITPNNRIYCSTHWGEMNQCPARYCGTQIHHGDSAVVVVRDDGVMYCHRCYFRRLPRFFPVRHPNSWDFRAGCSCQACRFLANVSGQPHWASLPISNMARVRGICTECNDAGVAQADLLTFDGRDLCHTCLYDKVVTCSECSLDVLHEMVHPVSMNRTVERATRSARYAQAFADSNPQSDQFRMTTAGTITSTDTTFVSPPPNSASEALRRLTERQGAQPIPPVEFHPVEDMVEDMGAEPAPAPTSGRPLPTVVCDSCMTNKTTHWLCLVQCGMWFEIDHVCRCDGIHRWSFKPDHLLFQQAKDQRNVDPDITPYLGFELEVETIGDDTSRRQGAAILRDIASPWAYAVHDGTLLDSGQSGFEVVTHPFTFNWFNENWPSIETLLDTFRNAGYRSWEGGRCGMHVHISRAPMTEAHQMKFIQFIYGSSNLAMAVGQRGPRDRGLAHFAPFDRENRNEFISKIRHNINPGADGHYAALSATQPATYEARWFRGTLQPDSFRKNIEFVHAAWMFTRKFGFASSNEINFIEWLRDPRYSSDYGTLLEYLEQHYITRR